MDDVRSDVRRAGLGWAWRVTLTPEHAPTGQRHPHWREGWVWTRAGARRQMTDAMFDLEDLRLRLGWAYTEEQAAKVRDLLERSGQRSASWAESNRPPARARHPTGHGP